MSGNGQYVSGDRLASIHSCAYVTYVTSKDENALHDKVQAWLRKSIFWPLANMAEIEFRNPIAHSSAGGSTCCAAIVVMTEGH
jgi:hypothetical protein